MKLDYYVNAVDGLPIVRTYDFTEFEISALLLAIQELSMERNTYFEVHSMIGILSINGCQFTLRLNKWDQAIVRISPSNFECGFTAGTWENIAGLVEPFTHGAGGFQWLADTPGEALWLLSTTGGW